MVAECHMSVMPAISLFIMLDVTVLVLVGTQLHGWDSYAGFAVGWHPTWDWDSHAGTSLFTSWYLASTVELPRW